MTAVKAGDLIEASKGEVRVVDRAAASLFDGRRPVLRAMDGRPFVEGLEARGWTITVLESSPPTDFGTVLSFGNDRGEWWSYVCTHDGLLIPFAPTEAEERKGRGLRIDDVYDTRGRKVKVISRPVADVVTEVLTEVRDRAITRDADSVTVRRLVLENIATDLGGNS